MADEKTSLLASDNYETDTLAKVRAVENRVKGYYVKGMKFVRAREFMAEFLATFLLVVRHILFCPVYLQQAS